MRSVAYTAVFAAILSIASCSYNAFDARIAALEQQVPTHVGQISAIQANEITTSDSIKRLEKKIDWIIEHVALRK